MPTLTLISYYRDNQDGSTRTIFYNNEVELDNALRDKDKGPLTAAKIREEDDPYEDGYISNITFDLSVDDRGNYSLTKPVSIGFG